MKPSRLTAFLLSVSLTITLTSRFSMAGEGFFSADGRTVTMGLARTLTGLVEVDIATGKITHAPLPKELKNEPIESVARGGEGEALFLAKDTVWVWKADSTPPVKRVCATAPVVGATDLFVATKSGTPLTDCLFVSGTENDETRGMGSFYGRKPGAKTFASIFCRRVESATGGMFSSDGRLFFVSGGDVWEGGIQPEEDGGVDRLGVLIGARIAPLAILNTDEGNSGGMWVNHVQPAGNWLYAYLRGRHMASIMRFPIPAKPLHAPGADDFPTEKDQIDAMAQALGRVEIIADGFDYVQGFCATEVAGKPRVFYCTRLDDKGTAMVLWEGQEKPRVIGYLPEQ